jgi:O-antigen/teichoic acid export membrane protein
LNLSFTKSSLLKSASIYTISSIINASIPFILLPLLTNRLSPSDYGIVAMFQLLVSIVYPFVGINLEGAIARKYYDNLNTDFSKYVGSCFVISIASFSFLSIVFFVNTRWIASAVSLPESWIKFVLLTAFSQFSIAVLLVIYQTSLKSIKYGIFQIAQSVLNILLTLLFIIYYQKTWEGRLEAIFLSTFSFAIFSLFLLIKSNKINLKSGKSNYLHALKFGIPLIPHAIGAMLFTSIDRFFLTKNFGLEQTGNYTVAYQIGAIVSIITVAFNNAFVPWLYKSLKKNDFSLKVKIVKFTYAYFMILIIGSLLLLVSFPHIINLFISNKYKSVNSFSLFIVLGLVFQGMYFMVTNYISYVNKTYIQAIITISVALFKIPLTYILILWLGAVGASVSFFLTFFIFFIATWYFSAKVYEMPWNLIKFK